MLLAVGITSGIFKFFKWLHIGTAIVGFGAVVLNGVYAAQAQKRQGAARTAVLEANHFVSTIGEYFIYVVFLLGFALVGTSDKVWKFSQTWVWLAIVLYLIAIGIAHGVLIPGAKKAIALSTGMESGGTAEQGAEYDALMKRVAPFGAINDVLLFVILYLMVFKPGV